MEFSGLKAKFAKINAAILGVSPDPVESHKRFIEKKGITITLLSDTQHEVLETYGAWGTKKVGGKEKVGVIRSTVLIDPKGAVAHVWPKVKAKGHAEDVLETLRQKVKERS